MKIFNCFSYFFREATSFKTVSVPGFILKSMLLFLFISSLTGTIFGNDLPSPSTGAADGKALSILFLRGNVEIGFGEPIPINEELQKRMRGCGWELSFARDFNPLSIEYLRQFNVVIWINPSPYSAGSRYFGPDSWQGGMHMNTVRENAIVLEKYAAEGGGLLINPAIEEIGMPISDAHNEILMPYGIGTECAQVRDKVHEIEFEKIGKKFPIYVSWTENIAEHPVTEGVKRIYYPAYTMRWDDNVTTLPLYSKDSSWIPFVKAMPEAKVSWYRGTPYEVGHWKDAEGRETPIIAAGRDYKAGRVAVIGICHFHLFYYPYGSVPRHAECYFGAQDGKLMEKGFDGVPGHSAKLLENICRWLALPGIRLGFGQRDEGKAVALKEIPVQPVSNTSEVWADKDPMNIGKVRPMKILIGARSQLSGGKGSVREFAEAAKKSGIDVLAFTEKFEEMDDKKYMDFVRECRENSDDKLWLLPGIDVEDAIGNRFLVLGLSSPIRPHLLTENEEDAPGKKLIWTGHLLLGLGEVLPVAARPGKLALQREKGALPPDLYSHCPGIAVETYRDGKMVDDGLFAYKWHLFNASIPIPVAVHELDSPEEIEVASKTGMHSYVNADSPEHAAFYFKQGHMSAGGNPMRYYVSSGPMIDSAGIDNWKSENWTISVASHGEAPISELSAQDQFGLYRRISANSLKAEFKFSGDLGVQRWFLIEVDDEKGGRAILSPIRTLPERNFVRCLDRQNWFGNLHPKFLTYTGRVRAMPASGASIPLPGQKLPADPCPRLQLKYIGAGFAVTEYLMDMTLVPGAKPTGADNAPIFNALPNEFFDASIRYLFLFPTGSKTTSPEMLISKISLTLKKDMPIVGEIWPVVGKVEKIKAGSKCILGSGAERREEELRKNSFVDLPTGGAVGNMILLSPLRVSDKGLLGFANSAKDAVAKAASSYNAAFLSLPQDSDIPLARKSMGFDSPPPFELSLSQGKLEKIEVGAFCSAENCGITASLKVSSKESLWNQKRFLPFFVKGLNPNWPIGLWSAETGAIQSFGSLDGTAMGSFDASKDSSFYFGNLLIASDPGIRLAFASEWSNGPLLIEAQNPGDKEISFKIKTPGAIKGKIPVSERISLKPGESRYIRIE